jgi:hypothetical protein
MVMPSNSDAMLGMATSNSAKAQNTMSERRMGQWLEESRRRCISSR